MLLPQGIHEGQANRPVIASASADLERGGDRRCKPLAVKIEREQILKSRIRTLELENERLRERIDFLEGVPSLRAGILGESLIAQLVNGKITAHAAPHDVIVTNGTKLEVKYSRLNIPMQTSTSRRWSWAHPLGLRGGKDFDRLLLIGEADPRYRQSYKESGSPYVIFDVPYEAAVNMNRKDQMIQITTDPNRKDPRSDVRNQLFQCFQTTLTELKRRYGISSK